MAHTMTLEVVWSQSLYRQGKCPGLSSFASIEGPTEEPVTTTGAARKSEPRRRVGAAMSARSSQGQGDVDQAAEVSNVTARRPEEERVEDQDEHNKPCGQVCRERQDHADAGRPRERRHEARKTADAEQLVPGHQPRHGCAAECGDGPEVRPAPQAVEVHLVPTSKREQRGRVQRLQRIGDVTDANAGHDVRGPLPEAHEDRLLPGAEKEPEAMRLDQHGSGSSDVVTPGNPAGAICRQKIRVEEPHVAQGNRHAQIVVGSARGASGDPGDPALRAGERGRTDPSVIHSTSGLTGNGHIVDVRQAFGIVRKFAVLRSE